MFWKKIAYTKYTYYNTWFGSGCQKSKKKLKFTTNVLYQMKQLRYISHPW